MDVNTFANVVGYRPSVIKWVGKDLTSDIISKSNDCVPSTLDEDAMSAQEHKQNKHFDELSEDYQVTTINNDESFFSKSNNAKKSYDCQTCNKSFKWRSHWKSHERIHTGERPFKCEICGKTFTRSDGLQCHKKVHLKIIKPCSTANQPHYTLGENTVEDGIKQDNIFICIYCGRTFSSLAGYDRHIEKKHKGLKCTFLYRRIYKYIFVNV